MNAAELASEAVKVLASEGADTLFGLPGGGGNLEVIGAAEAAGMRFVLGHSEAAAAYMAAVYAELTGTPAACVATRGPGAASAVNGVAQAWLDRQPLVLITDTVSGTDASRITHQQLDQQALFSPITKWNGVLNGCDPVGTMRYAVGVSQSPAPGPVHLDFDPSATSRPPLPGRTTFWSARGNLAEVRAVLDGVRRPVVLVGMGARTSVHAVRALVRETNIPVLQTYRAQGVVPASWPNCAGVLTGAAIEAPVLSAADAIVAIGLDTVELIPNPWLYTAPVVSLAPWPDNSVYFRPAAEIIGPLDELLASLGAMPDRWEPGFASTARSRAVASVVSGPPSGGLTPTAITRAIRAGRPRGAMATVDSGAHMLPLLMLWDTEEPLEILISSGLATMGFGLPAAIAAALACKGRRIFCFTGDGGLGMVLSELETTARLNLPITIIVFNDSALSLIKAKQKAYGHGGADAVSYRPTDFASLAAAMGVPALRVSTEEELDAASRHVCGDGPLLIDAVTDPSEYLHILAAVRGEGMK